MKGLNAALLSSTGEPKPEEPEYTPDPPSSPAAVALFNSVLRVTGEPKTQQNKKES